MSGKRLRLILSTGDFIVIDYMALLKSKLQPYRLEHSLQVAQSARELAVTYGADVEKAHLAGLLHDIMKDSTEKEQLLIIGKDGILLTSTEKANPKLWHAVAGAAYIRAELGILDEDIRNAILYHTTGRAGMSMLEKVIYVADYISADRTYNGIETMRSLAQTDLESAMLFALKFTIGKLTETGQVIHTNSVECYNELIIKASAKAEHTKA